MSKAALIRSATWLLRFIPEAGARAIALGVADVCWLVMRGRRRTLEENLRYTAPDRTASARRRLGRATFRNLARCTIDFLRIPSMSQAELMGLVDARGDEHLDQALAQGKGAILVSGHVGNWELAGPFYAARGYPAHVYAEDAGDGAETYRVYERYRGATGATLIPISRGGLAGCRVLQRGAVLAVLADRVITGRHHLVDFCGGSRALPIGPATLARRTGAPVLPWSLTLNPAGTPRYLGVIEPPVNPGREDDAHRFTQAIADRLSRIVQAHPDQWFVFQPHWRSRRTESPDDNGLSTATPD